jgi:hypothetical protein
MKPAILAILVMLVVDTELLSAAPPPTAKSKKLVPAFAFAERDYFARWSKDNQHEYTPVGQENLDAWSDMVTICYYATAKDGEALATVANSVLGNYQSAGARILRTDSVPRSKDKPAEHFVASVFGQPEFLEVAFARLVLHDGLGTGVIYSHRIYGKKVGNEMSAWLAQNGPNTEKALMKWNGFPKRHNDK